ncbi:MAG: hypothetical protein ACOC3Z_00470 [Nanoarchaeota archaeon]
MSIKLMDEKFFSLYRKNKKEIKPQIRQILGTKIPEELLDKLSIDKFKFFYMEDLTELIRRQFKGLEINIIGTDMELYRPFTVDFVLGSYLEKKKGNYKLSELIEYTISDHGKQNIKKLSNFKLYFDMDFKKVKQKDGKLIFDSAKYKDIQINFLCDIKKLKKLKRKENIIASFFYSFMSYYVLYFYHVYNDKTLDVLLFKSKDVLSPFKTIPFLSSFFYWAVKTKNLHTKTVISAYILMFLSYHLMNYLSDHKLPIYEMKKLGYYKDYIDNKLFNLKKKSRRRVLKEVKQINKNYIKHIKQMKKKSS